MAQPVKVSDALLVAARAAADIANRSVAAQIEHWASLGRSMEGHLTVQESTILKYSVREPPAQYGERDETVESVRLRVIDSLNGAGSSAASAEARREIESRGFPGYGTHKAFPGFIVEHRADGTMVPGRFANGQFVPLTAATVKSTTIAGARETKRRKAPAPTGRAKSRAARG